MYASRAWTSGTCFVERIRKVTGGKSSSLHEPPGAGFGGGDGGGDGGKQLFAFKQ